MEIQSNRKRLQGAKTSQAAKWIARFESTGLAKEGVQKDCVQRLKKTSMKKNSSKLKEKTLDIRK